MTPAEARAEFPVLDRFAYLNAGSFGPLPRSTARVMAEQARRDLEHGRGMKPYFDAMLELRRTVRAEVAAFIGAQPERLALTSSTTDGCNIVLSGLGLSADDEIVTTDAEHFGLAGPIFTSGARVRVAHVQGVPGIAALDAIADEVGARTKLIAVSHVLWTTGNLIDVHELRRRFDTPILVDGAQSVGAIPVDVGDIDFYTVSGQKWLCGPDSTGALYIRSPESLRVARPSYFAQQSFEPGGEYLPRETAERFDTGWISVAALHGLRASLALAPDWRYERLRELAAHCRAALEESGLRVVTDPNQAGLVTFAARDDPAEVAAHAYDQGVVIRSLPGTEWVRASCGWWNNEEDVARLVEAVA